MKKILYFLVCALLFVLINITVYSLDKTDEIWNNLDSETRNYLEELGIDEISFEELFELSPTRVIKFIFDISSNKTDSLKDEFAIIFAILILSSIASSFIKKTNKYAN